MPRLIIAMISFRLCLAMCLVILNTAEVPAQSAAEAEKAKKAQAYKEARMFNESLVLYRDLLRGDSSNVTYLSNTAYLLSRQGIHMSTSAQRLKAYSTARYLAEKAIRLDPRNAWAHFSLALALGRESEEAGVSKKVDNAKKIKIEAEKAIALDPTMAGPYHILGKWHQIVAGFNGFEQTMIHTFFGHGLEGGTYEDAFKNFNKAISLEPANVNHYYQLALTYLQRDAKGDKAKAKALFQQILKMDTPAHDDQLIKAEAQKQLKGLH